MDLHYSDGIAATRTMLAVQANAAALQRRLPGGWDLAPYAGEDLAAPRCAGPTCSFRSTRSTPCEPTRASRRGCRN